jgi:inositol phosphorylceramide mannosyltransferase catalytic subunit
MNPGWDMHFCDDTDRREGMKRLGQKYLSVYDAMPLMVMKGDFWRYAVLYMYGGIYIDIDVQCKLPLESYLPLRQPWAVVSLQWDDRYLAQWILITPPHHPVYQAVLDLIVERARKPVEDDDLVHARSGPAVWTDAVIDYLYPVGMGFQNLTIVDLPRQPHVWLPKKVSRENRAVSAFELAISRATFDSKGLRNGRLAPVKLWARVKPW